MIACVNAGIMEGQIAGSGRYVPPSSDRVIRRYLTFVTGCSLLKSPPTGTHREAYRGSTASAACRERLRNGWCCK